MPSYREGALGDAGTGDYEVGGSGEAQGVDEAVQSRLLRRYFTFGGSVEEDFGGFGVGDTGGEKLRGK